MAQKRIFIRSLYNKKKNKTNYKAHGKNMTEFLDPILFSSKEKQYLYNDLIFCLKFADDLLEKAKVIASCNDKIPDDIQQWLTKHEAHEEKIQKNFI
ncbi:hypothetical protein DERP_008865 [Dermatophagoides pteronyssinus]|uniref:Uncharacterized protein n=1 Tax=Dermatophagoides pteronyssinus TaxID=6956 RepID=A0ABQ8JNK8_DERPT|nr:hypothetical protein DERP_008865 [Dermatophagoides pteronyssinus]